MTLKTNTIIEGNCIEILKSFPESCIDLVFADPPYNLSGNSLKWEGKKQGGNWYMVDEEWDRFPSREAYMEFCENWLEALWRVLKNKGSMYICSTCHNIGELLYTWQKTQVSGS